MSAKINIIFLILVSAAVISTQAKPKAFVNTLDTSCDLSIFNGVNKICELQGLSDIKLFDTLQTPKNITSFRVVYSQIDDLPAIICDKMGPQLEVLEFQRSGLRSAARNSISNCTNLLVINLFGNNFRELPLEFFSRNMKLIQIRLAENNLETLPDEIFRNNQDLELLDLSSNNLATFSANLVVGLKKLRNLILDANELMNLDAEALVRETEQLQAVYLDYNLFPCQVLEEIINNLNFTEVKSTGINTKARDETLSSVMNIQCVNENFDEGSTVANLEDLVNIHLNASQIPAISKPPVETNTSTFLMKIPECVQCMEVLFKLNCAKMEKLSETFMQFD